MSAVALDLAPLAVDTGADGKMALRTNAVLSASDGDVKVAGQGASPLSIAFATMGLKVASLDVAKDGETTKVGGGLDANAGQLALVLPQAEQGARWQRSGHCRGAAAAGGRVLDPGSAQPRRHRQRARHHAASQGNQRDRRPERGGADGRAVAGRRHRPDDAADPVGARPCGRSRRQPASRCQPRRRSPGPCRRLGNRRRRPATAAAAAAARPPRSKRAGARRACRRRSRRQTRAAARSAPTGSRSPSTSSACARAAKATPTSPSPAPATSAT